MDDDYAELAMRFTLKRPFSIIRSSWVHFIGGVLVGCVCTVLIGSILDKSGLMAGKSTTERVQRLMAHLGEIGADHYRPCSDKVKELHELVTADPDQPKRLASVVSSIVIDGENCVDDLVQYVDSHQPLPDFSYYWVFEGSNARAENLGASLGDEGTLAIWILDKIDRGKMRFSLGMCCCCDQFDQQCEERLDACRSELIERWRDASRR